jgi:hypothetical protein
MVGGGSGLSQIAKLCMFGVGDLLAYTLHPLVCSCELR